MIQHLPHLTIQCPRLIDLDWKHDVRQAGAVFSHVLCFFVEAGVDRVILIPRNQTTRPRGLGVHKPIANARHILFLEASRPLVLMTLPVSVHLKHMVDELTSASRSCPNGFQQNPSFVVLQSFGVLLHAGRDLLIDLVIDGSSQFLVVQIFHPSFGMFLSVEILVHAHPFVQIGSEDPVEGCR